MVRTLLPRRFVQTVAESSDMCPSDKEKGTCCWLFSGNKESLIAAAASQCKSLSLPSTHKLFLSLCESPGIYLSLLAL
ncbi:hypothetical protein CgunFtcFv8_017234 [Champsocephalus gunnari]|uniref:Uncharacterized protein n=1 Tax=Champsocephalus gunnari TaxID=52237 RepID=A0AAN8HQY4_CHAGU|nr:hypothetical protein CgunFtcFv8_017234 [Champsocephalus gunnari]